MRTTPRRACCCALNGCQRCAYFMHCGPCEASGRDTPEKQAGREARRPKEARDA